MSFPNCIGFSMKLEVVPISVSVFGSYKLRHTSFGTSLASMEGADLSSDDGELKEVVPKKRGRPTGQGKNAKEK